jgi:hypothetical protein
MTAVETVENLIKLAAIVSDAVQKKGGSSVDWPTFLASQEFKAIEGAVMQLLRSLKATDVAETVNVINEKQQALLGNRSLMDLPTNKILQYAELGNVKVILAAQRVANAMDPTFAKWLVDSALPVLVRAAPLVLPLLV